MVKKLSAWSRYFPCALLVSTVVCATSAGQVDDSTRTAKRSAGNQATSSDEQHLSWDELKLAGARLSSYHSHQNAQASDANPKANLATFREVVQPVLLETCIDCHGPDTQEGNIRIDTLDPDLLHGKDVAWWVEIQAVLSNGEMPPPDDVEMEDADRSKIIEWLSAEIQLASIVRRAEGGHSSFRRMTRYEYNYALEDLLGLRLDFARDLPPDPVSADGFLNSSEMLHMSAMQLNAYREIGRKALRLATVRGDQPSPLFWGVSMADAADRVWKQQDAEENKLREKHKDDEKKLETAIAAHEKRIRAKVHAAHYFDHTTGRTGQIEWKYQGAKYAWPSDDELPATPKSHEQVAVLAKSQRMVVELGDQIPERGTLRVRVRAARAEPQKSYIPSLRLEFGWQASNDSAVSVRLGESDYAIDALPDAPQFYEWTFPISQIYPRNSVRGISKMGDLPSPSEFLRLVNSSGSHARIQIDYVEVTAPFYKQWPPASHKRIFPASEHADDEARYAREILANFMPRCWRRPVSAAEIEQKVALLANVRPECDDFQDAMIEVLATVLASPKFLYLTRTAGSQSRDKVNEHAHQSELAPRLSMFLWRSVPDQTLMEMAWRGELNQPEVLRDQVKRMLSDPRSERFSESFVRQWLGLQLLDYLDVDRKVYPKFRPELKRAMQREPVMFFAEMLHNDTSVLDFLHADYTVANEPLAKHYGIPGVRGNAFRRVALTGKHTGGLLTQAGLLAMNSDGKDSHPLKRGIWLLEKLLNDPPPPPPPAVPEIDLADPEIAKLTLKERIEDHRNDAACMSCHAKIDPWGIAFENYDAIGNWRDEIRGKPVDAESELFNGQPLHGVEGLKRYLLAERQDQFVRAVVYKLTTFALGRPLAFADRASVDQITANVRKQGDGLVTIVTEIVTSDLFRSE